MSRWRRTGAELSVRVAITVAVLCGSLCELSALDGPGRGTGCGGSPDSSEPIFAVSAVAFGHEVESGAALTELVRGALAARGVQSRAAAPPVECVAPDSSVCLQRTLAALESGALDVALVPAARAPPAPQLRDAGLEELGEAAPPQHRTCFAPPPLRALPELFDAAAASYHVSRDQLRGALAALSLDATPTYYCGNESAAIESATILTEDEVEAKLMRDVVLEHGLHACAVALGGAGVARVAAALAPRPVLVCGRALDAAALRRAGTAPLGPPPCLRADCPFEARWLLKLVNARALAISPSAGRVLARLSLDDAELQQLTNRAHSLGPEEAAHRAVVARPQPARSGGEVRVAVMVPASTAREAWDAAALRAAAELAEEDGAGAAHAFDFKVQLLDDACSGSRAFKHLTDALGSEFGALSAVAGPACGAAFGDVVRTAAGLRLPVLAYTERAGGAHSTGVAGSAVLLGAGDARQHAALWAALLTRFRWTRFALLSEQGSRAALAPAALAIDVLAHVELPGDGDRLDTALIEQWAAHVAAADGRIVYVSVEDARVVRAALCAGRRAGLLPAGGAVWLLPAALPPRWLHPAPGDTHNCTLAMLEEVAEGHLSAAPDWAASWAARAGDHPWSGRWSERCRRRTAPGATCDDPPPYAALLYDTLRLWAGALARLLAARPAALDDLHREDLVRGLVEDATGATYEGLTGVWQWVRERDGSGAARNVSLVLHQWFRGNRVPVGTWRHSTLTLAPGALRWATSDGRVPDDGGDRCALSSLAASLHGDCSAAWAVVGALALAALIALLAAVAWQCRRRAEREYRARLVALGMRALGPKMGGLDRWEVPRERVVINRKLGTGAFGTVYGGHALLAEDRGWSAVAVKTLKAGASTEEKLDFLSEAEAMKRFDHDNVVRLLAVVTQTEPVCTVMEFMLYGDLKNYLLARRHLAAGGEGGAADEVSAARLTRMALDVARALSYLAQLRYVHRDVAARNCLVSARRVVKLADFGMTRLVFEHDYYRFSRKGLLPVRWMAPESLALGVFSPASDVWAFGVLLYEIVTFGSLPFQGLANAEVLERVKAGRTLDLPAGLKPQLEGLIKSCWQRERRARPAAAAVAAFLADAPRLLAPCLDVPLDALPLDGSPAAGDCAEVRWVSWAAPTSAGTSGTDCTYLSAEPTTAPGSPPGPPPPPRETDVLLPAPA